MENKNTQPQAFYTKTPSAGASVNPNANTDKKYQPKKKNNLKNIFAVAGLLFFVIVALTGVFIAQRQVTKEGEEIKTVAPTAPESKPQAAVDDRNNCVVGFFVPKPGDAVCDSKTALTDFTINNGTLIPEANTFGPGDKFVFKITVSATDDTAGSVAIADILPDSLIFVDDPNNTPNLINSGQTVSINLGGMTAGETIDIEFGIQVVSELGDLSGGTQTNVATVTTNDNADTVSSCGYDFETIEGTVECISKNLYYGSTFNANSEIVPAGSALTRGEEYIYYITVNATNKTNGEVKIFDLFPTGALEFVSLLPENENVEFVDNLGNVGGGSIVFNMGVLEDEEVTLGFVVKVIDDVEAGELQNSAAVYAYPPESTEAEPLPNNSQCRINHIILPNGTAQCIEKEVFTDFEGTQMSANTKVDAGEEFVYRITIEATDETTGDVIVVDQLSADLTFVDDSQNTDGISYDSDTRQVSIDYGVLDSETKIIEFKVQVIADPSGNAINNIATVTTDTATSHSCEISLSPSEDTYACNESCETNADCQAINDNYVCYNANGDNLCRLESNLENTSCNPGSTPTPTPTPTPAPGCNELCETNADCSNSSHVCMTTADESNRCRLETIPNSETCVVQATTQPELPDVLLVSGPEDWLNWLKAGLVTLGVGTALFLLL